MNTDIPKIESEMPIEEIFWVRPEVPITSMEDALRELKKLETEVVNDVQLNNAIKVCRYIENNTNSFDFNEDGQPIKLEERKDEELKGLCEIWEEASVAVNAYFHNLIEDCVPGSKLLNYTICDKVLTLVTNPIFTNLLSKSNLENSKKLEEFKKTMESQMNEFLNLIKKECALNKKNSKKAKQKRKDAKLTAELNTMLHKQNYMKAKVEEKIEGDGDFELIDNELVY